MLDRKEEVTELTSEEVVKGLLDRVKDPEGLENVQQQLISRWDI